MSLQRVFGFSLAGLGFISLAAELLLLDSAADPGLRLETRIGIPGVMLIGLASISAVVLGGRLALLAPSGRTAPDAAAGSPSLPPGASGVRPPDGP